MTDTDDLVPDEPVPETHDLIRAVARHEPDVLEDLMQARVENLDASGLDARTYSLASIAALVALGASPASYLWHVGFARDAGVTPEEILGLLVALGPTVGTTRVVSAAPDIAMALGVDLELMDE
jgi:alkylhydroperoxidase/carboxymuconolactone decarboxylase family protein YurZ